MEEAFLKNKQEKRGDGSEAVFYDPEKEITEEEWEQIKSALKTYKNEDNWTEFFLLASDALKMFPDRRDELGVDEDEVSIDGWLKAESKLKGSVVGPKGIGTRWENFFLIVSAMGYVFPERVEKRLVDEKVLDNTVLNEIDEAIAGEIESAKERSNWLNFLRKADQANFLFPKELSESLKRDIERNEESIIEYVENLKKPGKWMTFCEIAGILKSFGIKLEIKEKEWENIKHELELSKEDSKGRKGKELNWVNSAAKMAIV